MTTRGNHRNTLHTMLSVCSYNGPAAVSALVAENRLLLTTHNNMVVQKHTLKSYEHTLTETYTIRTKGHAHHHSTLHTKSRGFSQTLWMHNAFGVATFQMIVAYVICALNLTLSQ